MTVKEFSDKYGIDYSTCYRASFSLKDSGSGMTRNYKEHDLFIAVKNELERSIKLHQEKAEKFIAMRDKLLEVF